MKIYNLIKDNIDYLKEEYNNIKIKPLQYNYKFSYLLLILSFLFYEIQYYIWPESINNFFLNILNMNTYLYFTILDLLTLIFIILVNYNELKTSFIHFKNNFKNFLKYLIFTLVIFAYINALIAFICNILVGELPDNQSALENYNYLYLISSSLIYAPIVEELIYRGFIRKFIKNKKIFIILSGFLFGLAHVIGSSSFIQYIYIFDYGFTGMYLAYLYTKYNNIFLNISAHFIINLIAVVSLLIRIFI